MKDKIVLEFSLSQKAFHRHGLLEMLKNNIANCIDRKQTDYMPIAIFDNLDQCDEWIRDKENDIKNYGMFKSFKGELIVL